MSRLSQADDAKEDKASESLKSLIKERVVTGIIQDAQAKMKKKHSLIVGDDHTIKILSHLLKIHELNEMSIGLVVNVAYPRERVNVSPIYFLSPTEKSIQAMCDDYKDLKKPQYGAPIHVYFSSSLSEVLIETIKKRGEFSKYVVTLKEIPCDFLVLEKRVFSFDRDSAFDELYINKAARADELLKTSKQLVSLMISMNEDPYIRFSKDSRMAGQLAHSLHHDLQTMKRNLSNFQPRENRATVIIVDRSDDPIAPLLYPLTFQAMVMDLLGSKIKDDKIDVGDMDAAESKDDADMPQSMRQMPDENDEIWVQYRHGFIGEVVSQLMDQYKAWKAANSVARMQQKRGNNDQSGHSAPSTTDLLNAAREFPQYQSLIKKYTTNIMLAENLINLYKKYNMQDLIALEQDIVTCINEDGVKCDRTKIQQEFCNSVLLDPKKPQELKLRMFMMYVVSQGGMKPETRRQLMAQSQFDETAEHIIINLASLGVLLQSDKPAQRGHKNKDYWKDMQNHAKSVCKNEGNILMRHTSYLEWILNQQTSQTLSENDFEWIEKPTQQPAKKVRDKVVTSYRRHKNKTGSSLKPTKNSSSGSDTSRLIIYVLGGVSYSEICSCYNVAAEKNVDVFVGSTSILSPAKYLELLSKSAGNDG